MDNDDEINQWLRNNDKSEQIVDGYEVIHRKTFLVSSCVHVYVA